MDLFVKLLLSIIYMASFVVLNFAIFKFRIKGHDKKITIMAVLVGSVNFYFKFVINSDYFMIIQLLTYIVMLAALMRFPLLFSCIVALGGAIAATVMDTSVSFAAVGLKLSTLDLMANDLTHFIIFHLAQTVIYFLIAGLLIRYKIGYNLIAHKYKFYVLEWFNLIWMMIIILLTSVLIYSSKNINVNSLHLFIIGIVTLGLIIYLGYGYIQNKQDRQLRKEVLDKLTKGRN
ncbi:hypothetical protein AB4114_11240 [Paenibacillus sp. 2RAB27]|uniref:hypothetical protein n=1 Tax=Paenibacillus sp. 2RAB27 TaxID=3232991 RepID=UPI003F950267